MRAGRPSTGAFRTSLKQKPEPEEAAVPGCRRARPSPALVRRSKRGDRPPKHYTEDTLLSAMEHAGAEDFAKTPDAERKGLGTPATRAAILEKLVRAGFVERRKKQLLPTDRGTELIRVMPEQLKSARLTAEWENKLKQVERGQLAPADFMAWDRGPDRRSCQDLCRGVGGRVRPVPA